MSELVRSHHWAIDRHSRKMRLVDFIKENPGVDERTIIKVMTKLLQISPRAIREYLSELEYEGEIENRDGKFYPYGYEEKSEEEKNEEAKTE